VGRNMPLNSTNVIRAPEGKDEITVVFIFYVAIVIRPAAIGGLPFNIVQHWVNTQIVGIVVTI
ncbi:MAG TPA: hypothetical protein VFB59_03880, partial [Candidatus Saccharimonadales bacterium]|nr:hypothetical protein [Candidatus Saccharimonadales bacterium]